MLVLARDPGEAITIDDMVEVTVLAVHGQVVKLGIDAPCDVHVNRKEIQEAKTRDRGCVVGVINRSLDEESAP